MSFLSMQVRGLAALRFGRANGGDAVEGDEVARAISSSRLMSFRHLVNVVSTGIVGRSN
jgi:hypothetical protein